MDAVVPVAVRLTGGATLVVVDLTDCFGISCLLGAGTIGRSGAPSAGLTFAEASCFLGGFSASSFGWPKEPCKMSRTSLVSNLDSGCPMPSSTPWKPPRPAAVDLVKEASASITYPAVSR